MIDMSLIVAFLALLSCVEPPPSTKAPPLPVAVTILGVNFDLLDRSVFCTPREKPLLLCFDLYDS